MCGIVGFLELRRTTGSLEPRVRKMSACLVHRGPDGDGHWVDDEAGIAFGHRRLAIIDLSDLAKQPMHSHDGRWVVTYNGEIYNFKVLRDELAAAGATFASRSDTEVLLEAIAAWGVPKTLERLDGMFGFAVWDRRERRLWLARDRFGEKPLYYTAESYRQFAFASELRPLETLADLDRSVDPEGLAEYLRYCAVPAPRSIYRSIRKLEPGQWVSITATGERKSGMYFRAIDSIERASKQSSLKGEEALDAIDEALSRSVKSRLVADVPVGAFLSAGIDSSLVTALMQKSGHGKVKTFTVGVAGYADDEAPLARRTSELLGTDHTEIYIGPKDALGLVDNLSSVYDEPYASTCQIPTWFVARLARQHVTVVLTGDAGDELFGGYTRHLTARRNNDVLSRLPMIVRRLGGFTSGMLSSALRAPRFSSHTRRQAMRMLTASELLNAGGIDGEYRTLVSAWQKPSMALMDKRPYKAREWPTVSDFAPAQATYIDTMTYLPDEILTNMDRATMSVSLEARVPFLNRDLFEVAWRVENGEKWQGQRGKVIMRKLARRYLPPEIFERKKTGFSVPVHEWMRGEMRDWVESMLSESALRDVGVFDPTIVRALWRDHLEGYSWDVLLWPILVFQGWASGRRAQIAA